MKWNDFIIATILVGLLSFGGGKAFIPMYDRFYIKDYHLITPEKLQEYIGYAVSLPGPISPIITGLVGFNTFGFIGFFIGLLVLSVPSLFLVFTINHYFKKLKDSKKVKFISMYITAIIMALMCFVIIELSIPYIWVSSIHYGFIIPIILGMTSLIIYIYKPYKILKAICLLLLCINILYYWPIIQSASIERNIIFFIVNIMVSLWALIKWKIHPLLLILLSCLVGVYIIYL